MSIITARLNNDTDIYSGPGESYESIDHILSEGVLNVYYSEGDWYYVSCSPDYLVFNTDTVYGYVHGSVLTGMTGIPNDNLASTPHTGYEVTGYYGPDSNAYDVCATLPEDQTVIVLWAEGSYYYVECVSDNDSMLRRMYIPQDSVDAFDGMPMTYTESYSEAELVNNTTGYTGPGTHYEASGEVTTDWAISKLDGTQENGFVLIEHPGSGNRYKRVWVDADALVIPNPDPVPEQPGGEGNEGGGDNTDEYVAMAITNNDSDIYSGPGEDYEIIDHIVAGETVGILSDEGNWCYIECPAGSLSFSSESLCGYIPTSVLDFISSEETTPPGIEGGGNNTNTDGDTINYTTAQTRECSELFYGPGNSYKFCDEVAAGSTVFVLWKEGDWYCVECSAADLSYNSCSVCGYIHSSALEGMTGTPSEETDITGHFADLGVVVTAYTGPGRDYAEAGEVLPEWEPSHINLITVNGFMHIEYLNADGEWIRSWISEDDLTGGFIDPTPDEPDTPDTPVTPDIVAYTTEDVDTYFGPNGDVYDYCDHLSEGTQVTVLWEEGEYYYVEVTYYNGTKNRMYIHKDSVGSFTGTVPDLTNADYLEVDFTEDVMCYTGPGTNYESKGITSPGGPHTLLRRKSENGFALIDTVAYDNIGMRVWADTNKIILPDLVTYTIDEADGYYGPGSTSYDYCDHLPAGELVTILWKEGDWYYVYVEGDSFGNVNVKRRMYVHKDSVGSFTGEASNNSTVQPTYALLSSDVSVVSGPAMVYEPIEYFDADTAVWQLGVGEENSCVFIEYTANSGLKRRGWVIKTAVNGFDVLPEVAWDIMGTINTTTAGYYGPNVEQYASAEINAIKDAPVYVLWQEGDWYYINHPTNSSGEDPQYNTDPKKNEICTPSRYRKCFYVPTSCVTLESNISVPVHQGNKINRPVAVNSDAYAGCGASYSFVGTAYTTDSVKWIDGLCRNGFAFIEYPISDGKLKRGWIPLSKFSDYMQTVSGHYEHESIGSKDGSNYRYEVLKVHPSHIVLTELGYKEIFSESKFIGTNAGFFTMSTSAQETHNIAANNGDFIMESFDTNTEDDYVYKGDRNAYGYSYFYWDGDELGEVNFKWGTPSQFILSKEDIKNYIWCQGGTNLQLDRQLTDIGLHHSLQEENANEETMSAENELKPQCRWGYHDEYYSKYRQRTLIAIDKMSKMVYLFAIRSGVTIPITREVLYDYFNRIEGIGCENIVAFNLDGGDSTSMRWSENGVYEQTNWKGEIRPLRQCIAIV